MVSMSRPESGGISVLIAMHVSKASEARVGIATQV